MTTTETRDGPDGSEREQIARIIALHGMGTTHGTDRLTPGPGWTDKEHRARVLTIIPEKAEAMCFAAADAIIAARSTSDPAGAGIVRALMAALEPFAKAGELFTAPAVDGYDQCVYAPAAGQEYAISGNHLRAARDALRTARSGDDDRGTIACLEAELGVRGTAAVFREAMRLAKEAASTARSGDASGDAGEALRAAVVDVCASGPVDGMDVRHPEGSYVRIFLAYKDGRSIRVRVSRGAAEALAVEINGILAAAPLPPAQVTTSGEREPLTAEGIKLYDALDFSDHIFSSSNAQINAAAAALTAPPAAQAQGVEDELTEAEIASRAKAIILGSGWRLGDSMHGTAVLGLMTKFGLSIMRDPPTDRCAHPDCGCEQDSLCSTALRARPAEIADRDGWQPIETAPTNKAIQVYIPNLDYYGNEGVYAGMLVDMGTGRRWMTFAWAMGRDMVGETRPTRWRPLPAAPQDKGDGR